MTTIVLKSGISVYTPLLLGEVRQYLQGGNKSGSFRAWIDNTMTTYPIELSAQDIAYIDISGSAPQSGVKSTIVGYSVPVLPIVNSQTSVADLYNADVSSYRAISVQITSTGTNTISWQGSNDNIAWYGINAQRVSTGSLVTSSSTADLYIAPVLYKYFRLRCTAWTSGIANAVVVLFSDPQGTNSVLATPSTNFPVIGSVAAGSAIGVTAPVRIGGSDGTNVRSILTDLSGSLTVGNSLKPTYTVSVQNAAPISVNYVVAALESGTTKIMRLRRIIIPNIGNATAAQKTVISILRTTAASTGGTTVTPALRDTSDSAYSGIAKTTNPTITSGTVLYQTSAYTPTTLGAFTPMIIDFAHPNMKAIIANVGIANGLAIRIDNGAAGYANLDIILEFTEE